LKRFVRPLAALLLVAITALALAACGGSSSNSTSSSSGGGGASANTSTSGGSSSSGSTPTINMVQGTFPQSLDPGKDYTTQGSEVNWIVYTGLVTYAHKNGKPGGQLIPGLATALPKISDGGKTYTATLRKGLKYSNGQPVKASDFIRSVERAVHIPVGRRRRVHHADHRRRGCVLDGQVQDDLRHQGQRQDRHDHDPPHQAVWPV
jgi:peptide/nickel transport system substrate-binding protein